MIELLIQDEEGRTEAAYADPRAIYALIDCSPRDARCMAFIDPYGDTIFNQLQMSVLAREMRAAIERMPLGPERLRAEALIAFVAQAVGKPHTFLRFVGD